ncbi:MAG: hypothetical protein KJ757_07650 [Planctomycetes bacterium]|nr:hypothetical protein [Planctomycetota bacterium]MBU1517580.1 hypothetical protein [Planctomycetota bacterium]MBU2457034.1 hypothetical protein [Planctomycetota bacterium]MBU2597415.1 hypothetical protein [Planctomycetota bacterium]
MAVVAPFSQYKKTNHKIYILMLVVAAAWFAYDGYFSRKFKAKHTKDGVADSTLVFHRKGPPYLLAGAVVIAVYSLIARNKKIVADEQELVLSAKEKIPYSSIESINKTNYDSKGYFIIAYKDSAGKELQKKISNRTFDNLDAVVELLVSKITG